MNDSRQPLVPFNHPRRSKLDFETRKSEQAETDVEGEKSESDNEGGSTSPMVKRKKSRTNNKITFDKTVNLRVAGYDGIQHLGLAEVLKHIPKTKVRQAVKKVLKRKKPKVKRVVKGKSKKGKRKTKRKKKKKGRK